MHLLVIPPKTDIYELLSFIRYEMDFYNFSEGHIRHINNMLE